MSSNRGTQTRGPSSNRRRSVFALIRFRRVPALLAVGGSLVEGCFEALILAGIAAVGLHFLQEGSGDISLPFGYEIGPRYLLLFILLAVVARFFVGVVSAAAKVNLSIELTIRLRSQLLASLSKADLQKVPEAGAGFLQNLILTWPLQAGNTFGNLITYLSNFMVTLGMLAVAFVLEPLASLGLVVALLAFSVLFRPMRERIRLVSKVSLKWQERSTRSIAELESAKREADIYGVAETLSGRTGDRLRSEALSRRGTLLIKSIISPLYVASTYGAVLMALFVLARFSSDSFSSMGPVLLIVLRSLSYGQSIQQAGATWSTFTPLMSRIDDSRKVLVESQRVENGLCVGEISSIKFDQASFEYRSQGNVTIYPTDLMISRGEKICIVGPSGAGKSTLAMLLLGVLVPTDGRVLINDVPVSDVSPQSLAKTVAFVPQSPTLISGTIADNVRFFRSNISDQDVMSALSRCGLLTEVVALEDGIDANIFRFEKQLSGGQIQRLALARAIVCDPTLLVLDEPTSAVDMPSEKKLIDAITTLPSNPAVVIVSHRLYALSRVDRLIVIEQGRLTGDGSPNVVRKENSYVRGITA